MAYTFKGSPYGSHSILVDSLPKRGDGRRVLDIGCAGGYLGAILAERGYEVTGVERPGGSSAGFPETVRLVEADLDAGLPDLAGTFDYVLCADILEHLKDPLALLRQIAPKLAAGGRLVASLPNSGNLYFRLTVLAGRFPRHDRGLFDRTHLHFLVWDGWVDLLARGGFRVERMRPTGVPVGLALPRIAGTLPVRAAERLSYLLAGAWKTLFAYQFVVTAAPIEGP
jgi:SAM-dependent methyltransferase